MNHGLAAFASLSILAACSSAPTGMGPTAKPMLNAAAQQALHHAEGDVQAARARFALWTGAASALQLAQDAAQEGNSELVIQHAAFASSQATLGIAQLSYPTTEAKR